jgi:hypothetical protein
LTRDKTVDASIYQVVWIPEKFAKVGQILKIKDENDEWVDGWKVEEAYQTMDEEYVRMQERVHTKTRKASDI